MVIARIYPKTSFRSGLIIKIKNNDSFTNNLLAFNSDINYELGYAMKDQLRTEILPILPKNMMEFYSRKKDDEI